MKTTLRALALACAIIALLSVLASPVAAGRAPVSEPLPAQESLECTPEIVSTWLLQRKALMNAAIDINRHYFADNLAVTQSVLLLQEIQMQLFLLPRPECVEDALLWTNFLWAGLAQAWLAVDAGNAQLADWALDRMRYYKDVGIPLAIEPLEQMTGIDLLDPQYADLRPPGWPESLSTPPAEPPAESSAPPTNNDNEVKA